MRTTKLVTDLPVTTDVQRTGIEDLTQALSRRQGGGEALDPLLDVLGRDVRKRSQVTPEHANVVPLVGIADDDIPDPRAVLEARAHNGRTDACAVLATVKLRMREDVGGRRLARLLRIWIHRPMC